MSVRWTTKGRGVAGRKEGWHEMVSAGSNGGTISFLPWEKRFPFYSWRVSHISIRLLRITYMRILSRKWWGWDPICFSNVTASCVSQTNSESTSKELGPNPTQLSSTDAAKMLPQGKGTNIPLLEEMSMTACPPMSGCSTSLRIGPLVIITQPKSRCLKEGGKLKVTHLCKHTKIPHGACHLIQACLKFSFTRQLGEREPSVYFTRVLIPAR